MDSCSLRCGLTRISEKENVMLNVCPPVKIASPVQSTDKLAKTKSVRRVRLEMKRVHNALLMASNLVSVNVDAAKMARDTAMLTDELKKVEVEQLIYDVTAMDITDIVTNAGRIARIHRSHS